MNNVYKEQEYRHRGGLIVVGLATNLTMRSPRIAKMGWEKL